MATKTEKWDETGIRAEYVAKVKIKLVEPMLGTVPKDRQIYEEHVISKIRKEIQKKRIDDERRQGFKDVLAAAQREEKETIVEVDEKGYTGFHYDEKSRQLFVYDYWVRGFLKSAAEALRERLELTFHKALIDKYVFVSPRRILLGKDQPDGILERALRAETARGPRICLAKSDYVDSGTEFSFEIHVLNQNKLPKTKLVELLRYGKSNGFGQFRNGSYGQFVFKVEFVDGKKQK